MSAKIQAWCEGALSGEELRELEAHLAACPACRKLAEDLRKLRGLLRSLPEVPPGTEFARTVFSRIDREEIERARRRTFYLKVSSLAALFLLVVTAGVLFYFEFGRSSPEPLDTARREKTPRVSGAARKRSGKKSGETLLAPEREALVRSRVKRSSACEEKEEREFLSPEGTFRKYAPQVVGAGAERPMKREKSSRESARSAVADSVSKAFPGDEETDTVRKTAPGETSGERTFTESLDLEKRSRKKKVLLDRGAEVAERIGHRAPAVEEAESGAALDRLQGGKKDKELVELRKSPSESLGESGKAPAGAGSGGVRVKARAAKPLNGPLRKKAQRALRPRVLRRKGRAPTPLERAEIELFWKEGADTDSVVAVLADTPETRSSLRALGIRVPAEKRSLLLKLDRSTLEKVVRLGAAWGPGKDAASGGEAAGRRRKDVSPRRFTVLLLLVPGARER